MAYKADSIFKNHFFNLLMQVINILFPIITIPYITRILGPKNLGKINFANSIVQYFLLLASLGIPVYAVREIAKVRDNSEALKKRFYEIALIQLLLTIISLIIYYFFIFSINDLYKEKYIYIFLSLQIISNALDFTWFIKGIEKYRYATIAMFFSKIFNFILLLILLKERSQYHLYALIIGISYFVYIFTNLIITIILLKQFKTRKIEFIQTKNLKYHLSGLAIFFLSQVAIKIYTVMDQTMLGIFSTNEAVGYYSMSMKLVKVILTLITSMSIVMLPRISNYISNNQIEDVKKYVSLSIKMVYILAIPAIFGTIGIGSEIIEVFLGKEFIESIFIFKLASILLIVIGLSNIFGIQIMIPFGKEKKFTIILIFAAIINFILNILFIPKLSYFGATYATIIAELFVTISMFFEVKKLLGSINDLYKPWKYVISSCIASVSIVLIKTYVSSNILIILTSIITFIIVYFIVLFIFKEDLVITAINKVRIKLNNL